MSLVVVALPLTLDFLEEARAPPQQLREHLPDGPHYRLELRRCEVAQAQVLPMSRRLWCGVRTGTTTDRRIGREHRHESGVCIHDSTQHAGALA